MNKLRSTFVVRPDPREDGLVKTSNVTSFLASCASYGLPDEDIFQHEDLIKATSESLARVAKTVIALFQTVDSPPPSRSKFMPGQVTPIPKVPPYGQAAISRATSSAPDLTTKPISPICSSPTRRRWSSPSDLPTSRKHSPDGNNSIGGANLSLNLHDICQNAEDDVADFGLVFVPESELKVPRSPQSRGTEHDNTWSTDVPSSQNHNP